MSEEYSARYRHFLKQLIKDIIKEIPDGKHSLAKADLENAKTSLWYQAPEILDNTLNKIFHVLQNHIPCHDDNKKNPDWIKNIRYIWDNALLQIKSGLTDSISKGEP